VVNFDVIKNRLIRFVSLRIRNGDCTQRQLAKLVGVSQPQLHNVLKGARRLRRELADALLAHFEISLIDLLEPTDISSATPQSRMGLSEILTIPRRPAALAPSSFDSLTGERRAS
jgi:transcriptional regulator with XRE-family HTH domain